MKINSKSMVKAHLLMLSLISMVLMNCSGPSKEAGIKLEDGFLNPPESAKPRVWWHWMNGNISKEGIKADLEWMKRVGIGGFQNFDAGLASPQVVEKRLIYMTPEWKDAFLFATKLADSLGLEMAIAGSPGWSESGGPWVLPNQAMKKLVWSELRIEGGKTFKGTLPKPPTTTGLFQNIPLASEFTVRRHRRNPSLPPLPEYFADAAVIAYRAPENDLPLAELKPKVSSSAGKFELSNLTDGNLAEFTILPAAKVNENAWIQFEFAKPETVHSLSIVCVETVMSSSGFPGPGFSRALEASDDGREFRIVFDIPDNESLQRTYTFKPSTARYFRISFRTLAPQTGELIPQRLIANAGIRIAEINLHMVPRVNRFEDKAGFTSASGLYMLATPSINSKDAINKNEVVDLTSKMASDGTLDWTPPDGKWVVLHFGYSLTGKRNFPASPEATGFEVDKLNAYHVKAFFDNYLDQYKNATGGLMGNRGLQYIITDSWEAGVLNWTDSMMTEFSRRRGYDMVNWLPVLTGHIVESAEASDRFLWDFRRTISDLTVENHYDQLTTILQNRGMGRYTESHEGGRAFVADGMEVKRKADIPMSATWTPGNEKEGVATEYKADVRESASVAHIYGQNLVAAESMTAYGNSFAFSPERLKPTADMELSTGVNRFVIHTSVHQPVDNKIPGLGLGPYGQWFTRHETWAEQAKAWTTYLARNSFMLQQGTFLADIIYYYGEDNNITALFGDKLPDIPEGYNYDFVNADALVNVLSVKNGQIITPSGMSYQLLALDPNSQHMSLPVLRKILKLVNSGAIVVGPEPIGSPSLSDDQDEFQAIAKQLWITGDGENKVGRGKIYAGQTVAEVLTTMHIPPDFEYTGPKDNLNLLYLHRKLSEADIDIYWVNNNNRSNRVEDMQVIFRMEGKAPEVWHPETGRIEQASYSISDGRTSVTLDLEPNDAVFVVFRKKANRSSMILPKPVERQLATVEGPWNVSFQSDRGAPDQIILERLSSWSDNTDQGVKYFSGTGTYTKTIQSPESWFKAGEKLWLDLVDVKNLAEVAVNGKSLGIIWKRPFRVEVTDVLKAGENSLEIKVTNLWVNRLIGDRQPGVTKKYTYTTQAFYQSDSPLLPSGLLGPVQIVNVTTK
jgi:hypothetical protein